MRLGRIDIIPEDDLNAKKLGSVEKETIQIRKNDGLKKKTKRLNNFTSHCYSLSSQHSITVSTNLMHCG